MRSLSALAAPLRPATGALALFSALSLALLAGGCGDKGGSTEPSETEDVVSDGFAADGDHAASDGSEIDGARVDGAGANSQTADAMKKGDATDALSGCPGAAGCPCEEDSDCDDGDPCTWGEICLFGSCSEGHPAPCDDGNACTDDYCDPALGCTQTANHALCSDQDACTQGDRCEGGVCLAQLPKTCDDQNKCTTDTCDPTQGCVFVHNNIECSAGNACVDKSFCIWGSCPTGKLKPCGDGDVCTWDTCDPVKGCTILKLIDLPLAATCDGAEIGGQCAQAFQSKGSWQEAREACLKWGGELMVVPDKQDNAIARALATKICGDKSAAWIGLSDQAKEGLWRWSDGSAPGYLNWNNGEPNNSGNEDFAVMNADGRWNDLGAKVTAGCHLCARPLAPSCDDGDACTPPGLCGTGGCEQSAPALSCDDGDPCSVDLCSPVTGCAHEAIDAPLPCGLGGSCQEGTCVLPQAATLIEASCLALKKALPKAPSGVWWIDPDGPEGKNKPFATYCDMATDGGGWTLLLKIDGTKNTMQYDAKAWSDESVVAADKPALDTQPAKLASYSSVPFSKLLLRLRTTVAPKAGSGAKAITSTREATLAIKASSLRALIAPGKHVPTTQGVQWWKHLLPKPSLQMSCQQEGFNTAPKAQGARVRIGIVGNNENDCNTPDSWLGIGGNANACGQKQGNAAGNIACYSPSNGYVKTRSFAWVLVR